MVSAKFVFLCLGYCCLGSLHAEKQYQFSSNRQEISENSFSRFPFVLHDLLRDKRQISTNTDDSGYFEETQCTNSSFRDLKSVIQITRAVACKPRKTVVPIPTNPNLQPGRYFPTHVEIPQCGGICSVLSKPNCLPVKTTEVPITITTFSSTLKKSCYTVTVTKHDKCDCECLLTEDDCRSKKQLFDRNLCQCMCMEHEKESRRCQKNQQILDPDTCRCTCRKTISCSTGHLFDPENCRCVQVANNPLVDWLS